MKAAERLSMMQEELAALNTDLPKLEENLAAQTAELDRLRREARAGRAEFAEVVSQQTRRDAAAGMVQQHLEDVASTRGMVDELEGAVLEGDAVRQVRETWACLGKSEREYLQMSEALEGRLRMELDRLAALSQTHREAQGRLFGLMQAAAVRGSGLDAQSVSQRLRQAQAGPVGPERDRQAAAVGAALDAFALLAVPEESAGLLGVVRRVASTGVVSLMPEHSPLTALAWETHSQR